jgi:hypothetical protein
MEGKKTYTAIAGVLVAAGAGMAARHGIDIGPFSPDLTDALVVVFAAVAAWARSTAKLTPVRDTQDDKPVVDPLA